MIAHIDITVKGRVQGVWFRASTKEQAIELGVKGFVKNLANSNVYIEAEGTPEQLNLFVVWCKMGPPLAHVSEVIQNKGKLKHFDRFEIR